MLTVLMASIGTYIALGIAVVSTTNYAFVRSESRLKNIRDSVPLVLAWPFVLYVLWAFKQR